MAAKEKKAVRRVVSVEFWSDDKVLDSFTPEDKLFMLYLLTNPHSSQIGVYNINKKTMAFEIGYSVETVSVLLDRFENSYHMIRYNPETHEIALKNYLRHSILTGGLPVEDLLRNEMEEVKDKSLLDFVFSSVINDKDLNASVRKIINEFYAACEQSAESSTEPRMESCAESCNESSDDTSNESCYESSTSRATSRTPSIINNQESYINKPSNINPVVVVNTKGRAREEPNNNNNPFGDGDSRPEMDTLAVYASNNIVNMNGRNMELLVGFRDYLPDELVRYAIDLANKSCKSGVPTYGYVEKILMKYVAQKVRSVEQAEMLEEAREAEKARSSPRAAPQQSFVDVRLQQIPWT